MKSSTSQLIKKIRNKIMRRYDVRNEYRHREWARLAADYLQSTNHRGPILDVGVGGGATSYWLAKYTKREVIGIDNYSMSIKKAIESCEGKRVNFIKANLCEYLAQGRKYTTICGFNILYGLKGETENFLKLARDSLNDDGLLILSIPNTKSPDFLASLEKYPDRKNHFLHENQEDYFNRRGFKVIKKIYSVYILDNMLHLRFPISLLKQDILYLLNKYSMHKKTISRYFMVFLEKEL